MTETGNPPRILVALATYNEINNIPRLYGVLRQTLPEAEILVVDDNSPDGTGHWAESVSEKDSNVTVLIRKNDRGLGSAVICALEYAIENKYDYVLNMDADFSHPVSVAPALIARMEMEPNVDVAIGSRYVPGGATPDWPLPRRIMSRCINLFAKITLGLKTHDNSGSYRCYRVSKLRELDFSQFASVGYSFFEETLFWLKRKNAKFAEIPIVFIDRRCGESKINRKEAIRAIWVLSKLGIKRFLGLC